ncbi:MAG: hypothetical protein AAF747_00915 [Planctomycetota bacterium]
MKPAAYRPSRRTIVIVVVASLLITAGTAGMLVLGGVESLLS